MPPRFKSAAYGREKPHDVQKALLDELMGAERNLDLEKAAQKKFWEGDVCKFYLLGCSPYQLLRKTKGFALTGMDAWVRHAYSTVLGKATPDTIKLDQVKCDVNLKRQFEALPAAERDKFGYEKLLLECINSLVRQSDRRITSNQEKLLAKSEAAVSDEAVTRITELDAKYKLKIEESERQGEVGEIDMSMKLMTEADAIRVQKTTYESMTIRNVDGGKRFIVCQTTGDLIESAAAADDAWMASHFESADFQGWKTLREWQTKLLAMRDGKGPKTKTKGSSSDDDEPRDRSPPPSRRRRRDRSPPAPAPSRARSPEQHRPSSSRRHHHRYRDEPPPGQQPREEHYYPTEAPRRRQQERSHSRDDDRPTYYRPVRRDGYYADRENDDYDRRRVQRDPRDHHPRDHHRDDRYEYERRQPRSRSPGEAY